MRILFILPYQVVPPSSGNKNLTANLLQFVTNVYSCDLVSLIEAEASSDEAIKSLRQAYPSLEHVAVFAKPKGWRRKLERIRAIFRGYHPSLGSHMSGPLRDWLKVNSQQYDLIHFDMIHTTLYRESCGSSASLLVASDAYSMAAWESMKLSNRWQVCARGSMEGWLLSNVERRQYRKFDVVCSVSDRDASYLYRQLRGTPVKTIGIGLGDEYSQREILHFAQAAAQKVEILITGSLDHEVVALGAVQFILESLPGIREEHPGIRVTILGKNPHKSLFELFACDPDLRHIDFVQNYADFLDQDWVYVYPQRCATGLQTKVQQAMALGLPVVGYAVSFGGLNVSSGHDCYICHDTEEMTQRVSSLLSNRLHRIAMGKAASANIRALFSIERIGSEMTCMYRLAIEVFNQRSSAYKDSAGSTFLKAMPQKEPSMSIHSWNEISTNPNSPEVLSFRVKTLREARELRLIENRVEYITHRAKGRKRSWTSAWLSTLESPLRPTHGSISTSLNPPALAWASIS